MSKPRHPRCRKLQPHFHLKQPSHRCAALAIYCRFCRLNARLFGCGFGRGDFPRRLDLSVTTVLFGSVRKFLRGSRTRVGHEMTPTNGSAVGKRETDTPDKSRSSLSPAGGSSMSEVQLRERVYSLAVRFPALGMKADICALTISELESAYRFLSRIECGG